MAALSFAQKIPSYHRQPKDADSGLLAISFGPLKAFYSGMGEKVTASIMFIKFDSPSAGDEGRNEEIMMSTYCKNGRAYLINAAPGKYAAAALFFKRITYGMSVGIGKGGISSSTSMKKASKIVFFTQEVVEKSTIEVKAGELAFMGDFQLKELKDISKGDEFQQRYFRRYSGYVKDPGQEEVPKRRMKKLTRKARRGELKKHDPLGFTPFLRIKMDFRGTGWNDIIQKRWQEILDKKEKAASE